MSSLLQDFGRSIENDDVVKVCVFDDVAGLAPPTIVNFGFAITMPTGSDQPIARAPAGSPTSSPRTRYHHLPGVSGSIAEVPYVSTGVPASLNGYFVALHCTS